MSDDKAPMPWRMPPMPWRMVMNTSGFVYIVDATGKKLGTLYGNAAQKQRVAGFIVGASRRRAEFLAKAAPAEKVPE